MPRQFTQTNSAGIPIAQENGWRNNLESRKTVEVGSELLLRLGELEDKVISPELYWNLVNEVKDLRNKISTLEGVMGVFYAEFNTNGSEREATLERNNAYNWFMRKWEDRKFIRRCKRRVFREWNEREDE